METISLYNVLEDENKTNTKISRNTVLIQELGHYFSGAYYKSNSPYQLIDKMARCINYYYNQYNGFN